MSFVYCSIYSLPPTPSSVTPSILSLPSLPFLPLSILLLLLPTVTQHTGSTSSFALSSSTTFVRVVHYIGARRRTNQVICNDTQRDDDSSIANAVRWNCCHRAFDSPGENSEASRSVPSGSGGRGRNASYTHELTRQTLLVQTDKDIFLYFYEQLQF